MKSDMSMNLKILSRMVKSVRGLILADEYTLDDEVRFRRLLLDLEIVLDDSGEAETITALREELKELRRLMYRDELTGVLNRRGVNEVFGNFFKEALFANENSEKRRGLIISDFSVIFIDLDDFKKINDQFGHEEGDKILKECAKFLESRVREIDAIGRYGGEEFIIGLLGTSEHGAYEKAEQLRKELQENIFVNNEVPLTASFGVASLKTTNAKTLEDLIRAADLAMYEAKLDLGKNMVARHSERKDHNS
jgi:diguanylate cyclase (GGDEF)-like protein